MNIARHEIDRELVTQMHRASMENLPFFQNAASENAKSQSMLMDRAIEAACLASVVARDPRALQQYLQLASDAAVAHFEAASGGMAKSSFVEPDCWIKGFFLAQICHSQHAIQTLCKISTDILRKSSTIQPEYRYVLVDALKALADNQSNTTSLLVKAMELTDPERDDIKAPDWVLDIDVQWIRLLFYTLSGHEAFEEALVHTLECHKEYWSKTKERRRDYLGFLPLEINGICAIACQRKVPFSVESDYVLLDLSSSP